MPRLSCHFESVCLGPCIGKSSKCNALQIYRSEEILAHNSFLVHKFQFNRFVPSKPINVTRMGVLKKNKKIGTGGVAEDIFERSGHDLGSLEGERSRHPSLVHYFQYDWNSDQHVHLDGVDDDEINNRTDSALLRMNKNPDFAARPPKEEPLWMRKGEAMKAQSMNDRLAAMFMQNIKQGHFSDGSDAVKQAPVPKAYADAKEWVKGKSRDGTNEE